MSHFPRLQTVIAQTLKIDAPLVKPESTSDDFPAQWDSMGQVNLIMALEEAFEVYIEPEDFETLKSVAAIQALLVREGAPGA